MRSKELNEEFQKLLTKVDEWRLARNELLHSAVDVNAGEDKHLEQMLKEAAKTAKDGLALSRKVDAYVRKMNTHPKVSE